MHSLQEVLPKVYRQGAGDRRAEEELVISYWPEVVGREIAVRTRAAALRRGTLLVEMWDAEWRKQVLPLRYRIMAELNRALGGDVVSKIHLRLTRAEGKPPRRAEDRKPARPLSPADDGGAGVEDPHLRRIYHASLRRDKEKGRREEKRIRANEVEVRK